MRSEVRMEPNMFKKNTKWKTRLEHCSKCLTSTTGHAHTNMWTHRLCYKCVFPEMKGLKEQIHLYQCFPFLDVLGMTQFLRAVA